MPRFFIAHKIIGDSVSISNLEQLHHLRDVLRLKVGDEVVLFDDEANEYVSVISEITKKQAVLKVIARKHIEDKKTRVVVACAIPKKQKMDDIIDKLTQLGIDSIIPIETERVIVKLDERKREERLKHWKAIARNAAQQSQRNNLPGIQPVTGISDVISGAKEFGLKLIPALFGERKHIKDVFAESKPKSILILIGPEGDFTPQEIKMALDAGFIPVSLGNHVLRVDTAAIAVASYTMFTFNG